MAASLVKALVRTVAGSAALVAAVWLLMLADTRPAAAQCSPGNVNSEVVTFGSNNPCSPPPPPVSTPTPTVTGADSSGNSINGLAGQRFNQMITNQVLGSVLLGVNEQVNCSDCISAFGSFGSFMAGIHGRKELTNNLSLLAGLAYTQYNENGYHITSAPIGAQYCTKACSAGSTLARISGVCPLSIASVARQPAAAGDGPSTGLTAACAGPWGACCSGRRRPPPCPRSHL